MYILSIYLLIPTQFYYTIFYLTYRLFASNPDHLARKGINRAWSARLLKLKNLLISIEGMGRPIKSIKSQIHISRYSTSRHSQPILGSSKVVLEEIKNSLDVNVKRQD